jgi:hypothetical protein
MLLLLPLLFYSNTDDDSRWRDQGKREVAPEKVALPRARLSVRPLVSLSLYFWLERSLLLIYAGSFFCTKRRRKRWTSSSAIKFKILQLVGYHRQSLRSSIRIPDRQKSYIQQDAETEKESKSNEWIHKTAGCHDNWRTSENRFFFLPNTE